MKPIIIFFAACLLLTACNSQRKALNRANLYALNNPNWLAERCAESFKDPEQKYLPGRIDTVPGKTITIKGDSIPCPNGTKTKAPDKTVNCPPSTHQTDTVLLDKPATLAKIAAQANQITALGIDTAKLKQSLKTAENKVKEQSRIIWILSGVIFAAVVFGVWRVVRG